VLQGAWQLSQSKNWEQLLLWLHFSAEPLLIVLDNAERVLHNEGDTKVSKCRAQSIGHHRCLTGCLLARRQLVHIYASGWQLSAAVS
jgi:hypothetical protein